MKIRHSILSLVGVAAVALVSRYQHRGDIKPNSFASDPEVMQLEAKAKQQGKSTQAWIDLGNTLMQKSRDRVVHDFSAASDAYSKALALEPENPEAIVGMAWVKNSEHDFSEGKKWAEKAITINPYQIEAHALLGDGAVELGDYEAAYDHYQDALDVRADLSTLSRAGHLLWITGDATQARALMQRAIDAGGPHAENAAWCRAELALMNFHTGALLPAQQQVEKALQAAPENPRVLAAAARIHAAKKDYPKAISLYEQSAAITPNHDALAALVDLYRITGQEEKAKKQFDLVVAFHLSNSHQHGDGLTHSHAHPGGNAQLARFYADQGQRIDEALKEAQLAYESYKNIGTIDTLAWCLLLSGKPEEARRMIARAMKWKTPDAEIYFHAGMIELALKHDGAAKGHFAKALNLNPSFHPLYAAKSAEMLAKVNERQFAGLQATTK